MRTSFFLIMILLVVLWPSMAGCAEGNRHHMRSSRDASVPSPVGMDAAMPVPMPMSADASVIPVDAGMSGVVQMDPDAGRVVSTARESCNGLDDDADGSVDEAFLCPLGREGDRCVTTCGAIGFRVCEAPTCGWSETCYPFDETCDTIDNDCDGAVDEGCASASCDELAGHGSLRISLDPAVMGSCPHGWTTVLWGSGGASESYHSAPGMPLVVPIRTDWRGWVAMTAFCDDWTGVKDWSAFEGRSAREAGVRIMADATDLSDDTHVCFDPGGLIIRPLLPVECPLPDCPGPSW